VDAFKEQLRAINARPIKKIAEAKARKKMKALKRWEKLKAQAEAIANSEGQSEAEKLRAIQKLYKGQLGKKAGQKRPERVYVVSKKGGGTAMVGSKKKGAVTVRVDPRMKKDKRALKAAERRKEKAQKLRNKKRAKSQSRKKG